MNAVIISNTNVNGLTNADCASNVNERDHH